jgi:hypothetical protein
MITAGEGPISAVVLESTFDVIAVEEMLLDMPIVGDATVFVDVPNPSSFIELSREACSFTIGRMCIGRALKH